MSSDVPGAHEPDPAIVPEPTIKTCWRCRRDSTANDGICPFCRARLARKPQESTPSAAHSHRPSIHPLFKVIIGFSIMMMASIIWGWIIHFGQHSVEFLIAGTIALEVFDALLVLAIFAWVGRIPLPERGRGSPLLFWLLGGPAQAAVIVVTLVYCRWLEQFVRWPEWYQFAPLLEGVTLRNVLVVAVQPAIVEELFFRYLALGALRQVSGLHAAVWISAVMFAFAHIYAPLGIPWLIIAGAVFGYARVGGGLLLPMLMHFAHNLFVLAIEGRV